nr:nitroreductase family protein [Nocardioides alcanivorans]
MRRRRMHRVYEDRPVPREIVEKMVWAAQRAQQGRSGVRNIVVVDDPQLLDAARQLLPGWVNNAPVMIVHCTDLQKAADVGGEHSIDLSTRLDAGAAAAHLALMAQVLGLGTCTITSWTETIVKTLLGLPDHIRPDVTTAVGWVPKTPPKPAKGFKTSLHYNRYGTDFVKVEH